MSGIILRSSVLSHLVSSKHDTLLAPPTTNLLSYVHDGSILPNMNERYLYLLLVSFGAGVCILAWSRCSTTTAHSVSIRYSMGLSGDLTTCLTGQAK